MAAISKNWASTHKTSWSALRYLPLSVAGSSRAPLALAPRKETLMTGKDRFPGIVDKALIEIEDIKGQFPRTTAEQKNGTAAGAGNFEFRPLTEEEKQEFVNSLDARGKQLLAQFEPRRYSHALKREP